MKRILIVSMLAMLTAMPSMAQYTRRSYNRPVAPYRAGYQTSDPRFHSPIGGYFGLRLGVGASVVNADDHQLDGGSPKAGLNVGFAAGIQVAPATPLYLESGLYYIEKGGKGSHNGSYTYNMNYLEMPFLVKYQHNFDRLTSIQPFAGFYGALGVGGKIKEKDQRLSYNSFSDNAFKRLDGGLCIGCGLQFDHLYAELGCDIGLANVSHDDYDRAHTSSFFANVGVNF
jgi:hypothetical protein